MTNRSTLRTLTLPLGSLFAIAIFLSAAPSHSSPQTATAIHQLVLTLDPSQTKLHWTVDSTLHTVHGTFTIKQGSIQFDPDSGKATGEIIVFTTSGESGNASRDEKMHKEVLQSPQFPEASFMPSQIEGHVASSGASDVKLHGTFSLHGKDHDLVVPVHVELAGTQWKGTAKFEVPYIQWGLKDPSNFLLKVKPVVLVELEMAGSLNPAK